MSLTREQVVEAALEVLDAKGLDGLSMRAVADRLDVQHNTIRWHAQSKAQLLVLMSDQLLDGCCDGPLPEGWRDRVEVLATRRRGALLSHRDGARMVAGITTTEPHTLRYAERMLEALLAGGLAQRDAAWTHLCIFYMTLGLTQEEQADDSGTLVAGSIDLGEYPVLESTREDLNSGSFDERFKFGLDGLLDGVAART
jgi:TetR/AcrR family transcriptional regulator, tetracycline repressor protein